MYKSKDGSIRIYEPSRSVPGYDELGNRIIRPRRLPLLVFVWGLTLIVALVFLAIENEWGLIL